MKQPQHAETKYVFSCLPSAPVLLDTLGNITIKGGAKVAKDSQIDPKEVRKAKSKQGPTVANDELDGEGRNTKKHSVKPQGHQKNK